MGAIAGRIKLDANLCVLILRDFLYTSALFGLVI